MLVLVCLIAFDLGLFLLSAYAHELVHVQINNYYGIESQVRYAWPLEFWTENDTPKNKSLQMALNAAHSNVEALAGNLTPVYLILLAFFNVFVIATWGV